MISQPETILKELNELSEKIGELELNSDYNKNTTSWKFSFSRLKNRFDILFNLAPSLLSVSLITMITMTVYEYIKQELHPDISVWESHTITIVFSGIVSTVAAYFVLRRFELLRRRNEKEIVTRMKAEKKLGKYRDELETRVAQRTVQLNEMNKRLINEIEHHRKTENARSTFEKRCSHLIKNTPVGIFQYDRQYRFVDFNQKILELLEVSASDLLSYKLNELKDKSVLPAIETVFNGNDGYYEGSFYSARSDKTFYILLKTAPFYDENGILQGGIGILDNITNRKQVEDALIIAKDKAEKSDKLKSEFLASMSHEIRTPVNTILSFTSLIREEVSGVIEPYLANSFEHIEKAGSRIIRTIDLILNMSEITTRTYTTKPVYLDLLPLIYGVKMKYDPECTKKGLSFEISDCACNTVIYSDEYGTEQIFLNVIDNAVKFTEKGKISVKLYNNQNSLVAEIKDTGKGISGEYLERLFTPFTQEEQGYTRSYEGNGLGLALTKNYADANNIRVEVESEKGKGSLFRFIMPLNTTL